MDTERNRTCGARLIITPLIHIITILATLPIVYFLPKSTRASFLAAAGAALLLAVAPGSFWLILVTGIEGLVLERVLRNLKKTSMLRQYLPYVLLINMFSTDLVNATHLDFATFGFAFAVIRLFMTTKQLQNQPGSTFRSRCGSMAVGGYFLPALVVGPVFSGTQVWAQGRPGAAEAAGSTEWLYRKMFSGWLLAALAAPWMLELAHGTGLLRPWGPVALVALFLNLFAGFWGQCLIAESGAALAGFTIPQNFDRPWLAVDIRDFWNRWHISMARFVMQYIFLPLNLRGVKPKVATTLAFVFMGLWHEVQIGYLIWGLTHGLVMANAPRISADSPARARLVSRFSTLTLVILLSYVANYAFK